MVAIEVVIAGIVGAYLTVVTAVMLYFAYGLGEQEELLEAGSETRRPEAPPDPEAA